MPKPLLADLSFKKKDDWLDLRIRVDLVQERFLVADARARRIPRALCRPLSAAFAQIRSKHNALQLSGGTGPTGTGKTVVVQQQLLKGFDKEFYPQIHLAVEV